MRAFDVGAADLVAHDCEKDYPIAAELLRAAINYVKECDRVADEMNAACAVVQKRAARAEAQLKRVLSNVEDMYGAAARRDVEEQ